MRFVPRQHLPHDTPPWVPTGALFFVTLHCAIRGREQLTLPETADRLLRSVEHYHNANRWFARLFLLMPDHAHALLAFPQPESMRMIVSAWKRYTARQIGVVWQQDFFDHRIRPGESWQIKADYIRANPVRKGLIADAPRWPWTFEPQPEGGARLSEPA